MTIADNDLIRNSVTRDDARLFATQGKALYIGLPSTGGFWGINDIGPLPPELPAPWSRYADRWLSATLLAETMWAAAVQKAITKRTARGWTIKDGAKSERRTTWSQNLLLQSQNRAGWVSYMTRTLRDFILTDNGSVSEIVRAKAGAGSRILGIQHLDAMRIWRTGDAQWPVIYEDLLGGMHPMRDYQVMTFVDMESPRAEARGTGICAARRAYQTIYKLMVLEQYINEKLSGTSPKEVHIINGIDMTQWEDAISTAQEQRRQRGNVRYMGVVAVPLLAMNATPSGYRIPIAEIPDGWSAKEERDNSYVKYADCLGVSVATIQPLQHQGFGSGMQSSVLDQAEKEEGLAAFDNQWEHMTNDRVLPTSTTFSWTAHDLADQRTQAETDKMQAETRKLMVETGEISAQQSAQLAADTGAIPDTFLPSDETPTDELTDSEKPQEDAPVLPTMSADERRARLMDRATTKEWTVSDVEAYTEGIRLALEAGTLKAEPVIRDGKIVEVSLVPVGKATRLTVADLDADAAMEAAQALIAEVRG